MALRRYEVRACDRCGTEVELMVTPEVWEGWWDARFSRLASSEENVLPHKADLCPTCVEALAEWWRYGASFNPQERDER